MGLILDSGVLIEREHGETEIVLSAITARKRDGYDGYIEAAGKNLNR